MLCQLRPGTNKRVLIYGVEGLGHQAIQLAKSYGATVYACDFKPAARDLALSVGADQVFDHAEPNAATADTAENPLTIDVAIDFVVNAQCKSFGKSKDIICAVTHFSVCSVLSTHQCREESWKRPQ